MSIVSSLQIYLSIYLSKLLLILYLRFFLRLRSASLIYEAKLLLLYDFLFADQKCAREFISYTCSNDYSTRRLAPRSKTVTGVVCALIASR